MFIRRPYLGSILSFASFVEGVVSRPDSVSLTRFLAQTTTFFEIFTLRYSEQATFSQKR